MEQFENGTKQCSQCKEIKNVVDFCKKNACSDGLSSQCRDCSAKYKKKYYREHQSELIQYGIEYNKTHKKQRSECYKQYRQKNKQERQEYTKEWRQKCKTEGRCTNCGSMCDDIKFCYCLNCRIKKNARVRSKENRAKANIYASNKMKTDIFYRIAQLLRARLRSAIKGNYKSGSAVRDLGCSIEEFKIYIENQFVEGQLWENWGCGENDWNLDHIKPLFMFDLTNREELLQACHYTNLRPLWRTDNMARTYEEFNKEE